MNDEWYLSRNGQRFGPYTGNEILDIKRMSHHANDLIWSTQLSNWMPIDTIDDELLSGRSSTAVSLPASKWPRITPTYIIAIIGLIGALGGGILSNWQSFFPAAVGVETCDQAIGRTPPPGLFAGIYTGFVTDKSGSIEIQIRLVRNGDSVRGNYYREGVCGSVLGDVTENTMHFSWNWAGGNGRGVAVQEGPRLAATSGVGVEEKGSGQLILYQRP